MRNSFFKTENSVYDFSHFGGVLMMSKNFGLRQAFAMAVGNNNGDVMKAGDESLGFFRKFSSWLVSSRPAGSYFAGDNLAIDFTQVRYMSREYRNKVVEYIPKPTCIIEVTFGAPFGFSINNLEYPVESVYEKYTQWLEERPV